MSTNRTVNKFIQWSITQQWNKWTTIMFNNINKCQRNTMNEKKVSEDYTQYATNFTKLNKKVKLNSILFKKPCENKKKVND